jgi:hypothetical protein
VACCADAHVRRCCSLQKLDLEASVYGPFGYCVKILWQTSAREPAVVPIDQRVRGRNPWIRRPEVTKAEVAYAESLGHIGEVIREYNL